MSAHSPEDEDKRERHTDDAERDIGHCQVDDVQVPRGVHLRAASHHEAHEDIGRQPRHDQQRVDHDQDHLELVGQISVVALLLKENIIRLAIREVDAQMGGVERDVVVARVVLVLLVVGAVLVRLGHEQVTEILVGEILVDVGDVAVAAGLRHPEGCFGVDGGRRTEGSVAVVLGCRRRLWQCAWHSHTPNPTDTCLAVQSGRRRRNHPP